MPGHLVYQLYSLVWSGLDWIYPPLCGGCGSRGSRWCSRCSSETQIISSPLCPVCGRPQEIEEICSRCLDSPPNYTALRSWAVFGGRIRNAIHRLKYKRDIALGEVLALSLVECLYELSWSVDIICPVPLGLARFVERGYNQAALLSKPVALRMGLSYRPKGLMRIRETKSQVGLSLASRRSNVAGAFRARGDLSAGKSILVIDDVTTSGATLDACAAALLEAGASRVYGLTLARSVSENPDPESQDSFWIQQDDVEFVLGVENRK